MAGSGGENVPDDIFYFVATDMAETQASARKVKRNTNSYVERLALLKSGALLNRRISFQNHFCVHFIVARAVERY